MAGREVSLGCLWRPQGLASHQIGPDSRLVGSPVGAGEVGNGQLLGKNGQNITEVGLYHEWTEKDWAENSCSEHYWVEHAGSTHGWADRDDSGHIS